MVAQHEDKHSTNRTLLGIPRGVDRSVTKKLSDPGILVLAQPHCDWRVRFDLHVIRGIGIVNQHTRAGMDESELITGTPKEVFGQLRERRRAAAVGRRSCRQEIAQSLEL